MKKLIFYAAIVLGIALQLLGCGSGTPEKPIQQKTATITFSAISTATLPAAISGIEISANLPQGVAVALEPTTANMISFSSLKNLKNNSLVSGSYVASSNQVNLILASTPPTILGFGNTGEFISLVCTFSPDLTLTENNFLSINPTFPDFKATGFITSGGTKTSVDLTSKLRPSMRVTF